LSYYVAESDLGTYAIAVTMAEIFWYIPDSLNFVLFNRLAANEDPETRGKLTERIHRLLLVGMTILAVLASFLVPFLVTWIFGEKYAGSITPLWLMLPGTVFFTSPKVLTKYFTSTGSPWIASWVTFSGMLSGLLTCVLMLSFFPGLGINSAAIATSIGYLMTMMLSIWIYRSLRGGITKSLYIPSVEDIAWLRKHISGERGSVKL
jgi:O-antigen/teichoic acid export membrane protein